MIRARFLIVATALSLVAFACGGGDADPVADNPTASEVVDSSGPATTALSVDVTSAVSADGAFEIQLPAGMAGVSITAVDPFLEAPPGVTTLGTFELGPDGATFAPPLMATFRIPTAIEPGAFAVTHLSQGVTETLDIEVEESSVSFALDSFSSVQIDRIDVADLKINAPRTARLFSPFTSFLSGTVARAEYDSVAIEPTGSTPPTPKFPLGGEWPEFACEAPDLTSISYEGPFEVRVVGDGPWGGYTTFAGDTSGATGEVECVAPRTIEPTDTRCFVFATGEPSTDCADGSSAVLSVLVNDNGVDLFADAYEVAPAAVVTFSIVGQGPIVFEWISDGELNAFYGPGLESLLESPTPTLFDTTGPPAVIGLELSVENGVVMFMNVGGETAGGMVVPPDMRPLESVSFIVNDGELLSIYNFEPAQFLEVFSVS